MDVRGRLIAGGVGMVVGLSASGVEAQEARPNDAKCKAELDARSFPMPPGSTESPCRPLGVYLHSRLIAVAGAPSAAAPAIEARDVQPAKPDTVAAAGSDGQVAAVPSGQPVSTAGGTLAVAGTGQGSRVVTGFSVNPLALAAPSDDVDYLTTATRVFDVSVLLPQNFADSSEEGLEYFGLRARFSFVGALKARSALDALSEAYQASAATSRDEINEINQSLQNPKTDVAACTQALELGSTEPTACKDIALRGPEARRKAEAALDQARADFREKLDATYAGLDMHADVGDLNPDLEGDQSGTSFGGGFAVGRRVDLAGSYGVWTRLRLGGTYFSLDEDLPVADPTEQAQEDNHTTFDGAFGMALDASDTAPSIQLSAGVEWRYGNANDADSGEDNATAAETDYLDARFGVAVPVTAGTSMGFGVSLPILHGGGREPVLTLSTDLMAMFASSDK